LVVARKWVPSGFMACLRKGNSRWSSLLSRLESIPILFVPIIIIFVAMGSY